jgi:hypothetical protein
MSGPLIARRKSLDSGFLPTDVTGCISWYDMSDSSTITTDANGVIELKDKSGQSYNLTQSNNTHKPIFSINSLIFDNTDSLNAATTFNPFYAFIVFELDGTAGDNGVFGSVNFVTNNASIVRFDTLNYTTPTNSDFATTAASGGLRLNGQSTNPVPNPFSANTKLLFALQRRLSISFDLALGNEFSNSRGLNGKIYEIIFYDVTPDISNIQAIENYLNDKWAIY